MNVIEVLLLALRNVKINTRQSAKTAIVEDAIGAPHPLIAWVLGMLDYVHTSLFGMLTIDSVDLPLITASRKTEKQLLVIQGLICLSPDFIRASLSKKFPGYLRNMGTPKFRL